MAQYFRSRGDSNLSAQGSGNLISWFYTVELSVERMCYSSKKPAPFTKIVKDAAPKLQSLDKSHHSALASIRVFEKTRLSLRVHKIIAGKMVPRSSIEHSKI
jgi:hypothetical protein